MQRQSFRSSLRWRISHYASMTHLLTWDSIRKKADSKHPDDLGELVGKA